MAARRFLVPIDMTKLEIQNQVVHTLAAAPSAPVKFQLYGNSGDNTLYWWDGTQWVAAKGAAAAVPSDTVTTQAVGDAAIPGASTLYSRGDHKHAREAFGAAIAETIFGGAKADGSALTVARSDHAHGNPTHVAADHSTIPLSSFAVPTTAINMNGQLLNNVATPVTALDGANKQYVDGVAQGLDAKASVRVATTANIANIASIPTPATQDGITMVDGDRILVKNQTTPSQNGIWIWNATGCYRAQDTDTWNELVSAYVWVEVGTTQADTGWVCTVDAGGTINTTAVTWVQFSGAGAVVAGGGLTSTGNTLDVGAGTGITVNPNDVSVSRSIGGNRVPLTYQAQIGDGVATSFTIQHNYNVGGTGGKGQDVDVSVYDAASGALVEADVTAPNPNQVVINFAVAPATNAYWVFILG